MSPCPLSFPKGGEGAGGHLGEGGLKEAAFFCLLPRPPHLPQQHLYPFVVGSSCCLQLSLPSLHPLPTLPPPPHPHPHILLSLLKHWSHVVIRYRSSLLMVCRS